MSRKIGCRGRNWTLIIKLFSNCAKDFCIAGKDFAVKALRRMNGDSIYYNLFGSGAS